MKTFNEYLEIVNKEIKAIPYPQTPSNLYEPISYTMALGGKRIRPVLVLMACDAVGGDVQQALKAAVGLELFHNFTLLHDDVMDNADVRRGQATVHRRWNSNVAILSGDTMLTMASQYMCQVPTEHLAAVNELFHATAIEVYEGQQYDMDYERRREVSVEEYINMIRLKTSVLLGCACKLGAIIGGADEKTAQALYEVGENLGIGFQLQDDVLDVWGDEATFGKEIGGDIMNNKKTYLMVNAFKLANEDQAGRLRRWYTDNYAMKQEKVPAVTRIYEELGLREIADKAMEEYTQKALSVLETIELSAEARESFGALAASLVKRNK
jgi:geranylgeranyl diphosphate synthase type II